MFADWSKRPEGSQALQRPYWCRGPFRAEETFVLFYQERADALARGRDWLKNLIAGHAAMSIPPLRPACSPGGSVDGRSFREAFADYVIDELSRPARPFNDDLLRGFPASRSLTEPAPGNAVRAG